MRLEAAVLSSSREPHIWPGSVSSMVSGTFMIITSMALRIFRTTPGIWLLRL